MDKAMKEDLIGAGIILLEVGAAAVAVLVALGVLGLSL